MKKYKTIFDMIDKVQYVAYDLVFDRIIVGTNFELSCQALENSVVFGTTYLLVLGEL